MESLIKSCDTPDFDFPFSCKSLFLKSEKIEAVKIDKIKLPNTKIKLLQKLLSQAIEEFKKVNRIKGVDFTKKMKKLVEVYNERKDFQAMQMYVR